MNDAGGNQDVRPAVPIALAPSERGSVFKQRTLALSNFGRKAALSKEEGSGIANDIARHEENFRSGLKRNIVQLSNLARVNKEKLARLQEQLKAKDEEILALKERAERARVDWQEDAAREPDLESFQSKKRCAKARLQHVKAYGNMAVMASRLASGTRQKLKKTAAEPSEKDLLEEEMAVAAVGAKHTEQQLLRASRDIRGQLERALQEAEALRADNVTLKSRANVAEKGKADLEARVAWLSDEVKLQTAPLMALRLELAQARSDTEMMRQRLKEERRESRLRVGGFEKASVDAIQRIERLEFDLNETSKALQREILKASAAEGLYQEASTAAKALHEEVEQRKADAKRIAQELTRMQMESDRPVERGQVGTAKARLVEKQQQAIIVTLEARIEKLLLQKAKDDETAKESSMEKQKQAAIETLEATTVEKLLLEKAKSDEAVKELQKRQGEAEERRLASKMAKNKSDDAAKELQKYREDAEERRLAFEAVKTRADSYAEENSRLRLAIEEHEEEQRQRDQERHDREVQHENETRARNLQSKSLRARLCRTLDELCEAEEAGELAITCLECAKLFKDPHVMAPCGHTLCAECSGRGFDGGLARAQPAEERSGWVLGGGVGDSTTRTKPACRLCVKNQAGGGPAEESACVGSAPSRALATLVTKFVFRRQLLESLKEIGVLLWQE